MLFVERNTMISASNGNISALLAFCGGNLPITGEFPSQRPVTRGFDVFFDLRLNQQLSKQWRRRWFETPLRSLWRHCNDSDLVMGSLLSLTSPVMNFLEPFSMHPGCLSFGYLIKYASEIKIQPIFLRKHAYICRKTGPPWLKWCHATYLVLITSEYERYQCFW